MLEFLLQLDQSLFLFLNGLNAPWADPVMYYISHKFTWIPFYVVLLWLLFRSFGWRVLLILLLIVLLITISDQVSVFMKNTFQRLRPSRDPELEGMVHLVYGKRSALYGFVSSHAANSFALAGFILFLLRKRWPLMVPVMLTFAILTAYSRIYLGVHYPGDVIGGALLGLAAAWIVKWIWIAINRRFFPGKPIQAQA